jgi:hypothetical protein
MSGGLLWDPCVAHRGQEARAFIATFFAQPHRRVLLVAGAGFDPRSGNACAALSAVAQARTTGAFLREERPEPVPSLVALAEKNLAEMRASVGTSDVLRIDVFAADGAVVGGRGAVSAIRNYALDAFTDIVVDLSALSIGVGYPLVRYVFERVRRLSAAPNLHVVVTDEPITDNAIVPTPSDAVGTVHGFKGGFGLDKNARGIRLWLPQLVANKNAILERIRSYVDPHEVCPILPFPAINPRLPDDLIERYASEFESAWEVDARNLVYADQRNPLDLYRTILRIDDARKRVFAGVGGSMVILSPLGSKALAAGALMAAMERDFPVAYVESIAYSVDFVQLDHRVEQHSELVHVWLTGEAYPQPQSPPENSA